MKSPDIVQAEDAVQLVDGRGVSCRGADVIACAVDVARVDAEAHTRGEAAQVAYGGEFLEGAAQDGTGACSCLEQHHGTVSIGMSKDVVQAPGRHLDPLLGALSPVSPWMNDEVRDAQVFRPAEVSDHAVSGLGQKVGVAGGKIHEVGGVYRSRHQVIQLHAALEPGDLVPRQGRRLPLELTLREDLKCLACAIDSVLRGVCHSTCYGHVCPEDHQPESPFISRTRKKV